MQRLYQWFRERASFFHSEEPGTCTSGTVRTEITAQRERVTLLVCGEATRVDLCPFCGSNLPSGQAEQSLFHGSISKETSPADDTPDARYRRARAEFMGNDQESQKKRRRKS